jgi:polyketide synthase-associated protein
MLQQRRSGSDLTYSHAVDPFSFSEDVVRFLGKKGFCTIFDLDSEQKCPDIVKELSANVEWKPTPAELADGLLGPKGCGRLATIQSGESALDAVDEMMSLFSGMLNPWSDYLVGCSMSSRTFTYAFETGEPTSTFQTPKEAFEWLEVLSWQKLLCLFFFGTWHVGA